MTTREYLRDKIEESLGNYRKGSPEVAAIWERVADMPPAQANSYGKTADWCGGYVLDRLHAAGLALKTRWKVGLGFVIALLGYDSITKTPKMGDIGIRQKDPRSGKDVWHHFFVARWNGPTDWDSWDGNSPGAALKHHTSLDPSITFYSIEELLPVMPEAGFVRGQEHSVPGVQDE